MPSLLTFALWLLPALEPSASLPAPFTAARFREYVAYLASDELAGRAVGSLGSAKATEYIIRHLKDAGAAGLGPGGAWLQRFPWITRVVVKSESSLASLDGPSFTLERDFTVAPESPDGDREGEIVFIGYGVTNPKLDYDDFAGVDLQGKVAMILWSTDLEQKWGECERRGAVALLVVRPKKQSGLRTEWRLQEGSQTRRIPSMWIEYAAAAKLFPKAGDSADGLAALESALTAGDKPKPQSRPLHRKVRLGVRLERTPVVGQNIVAIVPGKGELTKEAILVSAITIISVPIRSASKPARTAFTTAPTITPPAALLSCFWRKPCMPSGTTYPPPTVRSFSLRSMRKKWV